jgi:FkbM family methyltransferase
VDVCTIIAKNYIAQARVLARSFAEHHPDGRFHVLVIDDMEGYVVPEAEPFNVVGPGQLEIEHFERMAALYNVLELCTAVKPWLMRWVLARSPDDMVVYLDPDMRVYAPLDGMFAAVREHGLVLSPHSLDPMPRDGKRPNEQDILTAGAYNLGFIGIGSGEFADRFLDWWGERLATDCIVDPTRGFFVDQRWVDLVPGMAESFHLLRDRGFNVAYWNLSARPISRTEDGTWMAGSAPLRLFHFSGFDHLLPHLLSKHQNRVSLADHPDLAQLCRSYTVELLAAGVDDASEWPYTYATTRSGIPLNPVVRNVYRRLVAAGGMDGSVFEPAGEQEFLDHLNAPASDAAGGAVGITIYLAALYEERGDIGRAYPDIAGADAEGYLGWARIYGRGEVPSQLCPPSRGADVAAAPALERLGVNVVGYLNSELGVGEVARQAIRALDAADVPVLPVGIEAPVSRQGHAFAHGTPSRGGYPVNLICVNADMLPKFVADVGHPFFAGRHSIGWWWWEVAEFPERWLGSFDHVGEVWAGSRFVAEALAAVSPVPVIRIPVPVSVPGLPHSARERFGLPPEYAFLFSFDYASVLARKNPIGLIEAFLLAFPEPGQAMLVLKSINAGSHPDDHECVRLAASGHRHIVLLDGYLEPADKDRLVASCDCYVSLHRSEGFGITIAEAMFLGKPVIATGYSGNLDFMTSENSYLVDFELVAIGPHAAPYPPEGQWAEPDLEHAAVLMRRVFEDRAGARRRARRGASDIRRTHSPQASGARMAQRLRLIAARGSPSPSTWEAPAALERAAQADATLTAGPGESRSGRGKRLVRRIVLRLMRPHTAHQASFDRDSLDALQAIGRDVREVGQRAVSLEARALRGLRDVEHRLRNLLEPEVATGAARADDLAHQVAELRVKVAGGDARVDDLARQADELRLMRGPRRPPSENGGRPPVFEFHQQRRIELTTSCRDAETIPKVAGAGEIVQRDGVRVQTMHNGVVVVEDCYYPPWTTEIIRRLRGHHEPQEEAAFHLIIERLRQDPPGEPVMIELGSYWAYYSLWMARAFPDATLLLVEPDPEYLEVGRRNLGLNGVTGRFVAAAIGLPDGSVTEFECESDGVERRIPLLSVDGLIAREDIERVDVLLCDAQGAEVDMLAGARKALASGKIRFLVVSTHHHSICGDPEMHRRCLDAIIAAGGHIIAEHSVSESFSGDGLIAASMDDRDGDLHLEVARARAVDSLFGELAPELRRAIEERDAALAERADLAAALQQTRIDQIRGAD